MIARREPCIHIRLLSKDTVQKTVATELPAQCHLHSNIPTYYLCLHCAVPLCLQFEGQFSCLQYHQKTNPTHVFCLQVEQGSIWCHCCQDTIQNQLFDYGPEDKEDGVVKLRRFQKFISDAWKELLSKNNVKVVGSYHSGIRNLGNTCFLNVVLQSLFASLPLRHLYQRVDIKQERMFLQEKPVRKEIEYFYDDMIYKHEAQQWNIVSNKRDRSRQQSKKLFTNSIKNAKFNIIIKQFFKEMIKTQQSPFVPSKILNSICEFNDKYRQKHEQDAEQLFLLILDALNEGQRLNFLRDLERYKQIQAILGFQKLTPIQNIFSFYFLNEIYCSGCKQVNRSLNLAYSIPLAMGGDREAADRGHANGKVSIDYWQELSYPQANNCCPLLAPFFSIQRLCKAKNYYQCAKCRSLLAFRKYYIVNQPKILILSFKQFNAKLQKKTQKIEFPFQLTLEGVSLDKNHSKYSLYAVIVHQGMTITTGHYVCFILLDGQWMLCSDEKVQVVSPKYVLSQQPYVLLYQHM